MDFSFDINSDSLLHNRYLSKTEVLSYVTQEEIFELVFGFKPEEYHKVCSPLRVDFSPGAYFEYYNGKLFFIDWADSRRTHYDCFNAVQTYFKTPDFQTTLCFIKDHLIIGKEIKRKLESNNTAAHYPIKKKVEILFQSRAYLLSDKNFWEKYEITKENLLEDRVLPITKYKILNSKYGNYEGNATTLAYAYTDFLSGNRKIYFPYRKDSKRFLSTCNKNDIGGITKLDLKDPQLVITKSYKDFRVLKNQGYNAIWFQNEGTVPEDKYLLQLSSIYKDIILFYDNDESGIRALETVSQKIKEVTGVSTYNLHLPTFLLQEGIKDPSDLIYKKGKQELVNFLESNI